MVRGRGALSKGKRPDSFGRPSIDLIGCHIVIWPAFRLEITRKKVNAINIILSTKKGSSSGPF